MSNISSSSNQRDARADVKKGAGGAGRGGASPALNGKTRGAPRGRGGSIPGRTDQKSTSLTYRTKSPTGAPAPGEAATLGVKVSPILSAQGSPLSPGHPQQDTSPNHHHSKPQQNQHNQQQGHGPQGAAQNGGNVQNWGIPPRTHSAPPDLKEQQKSGIAYYPEKSTSSQQFEHTPYNYPQYMPYPPYNYYLPEQYGGPPVAYTSAAPPNRSPVASSPSFTTNISPNRASKAIPIIDPDTGGEISTNSPPKSPAVRPTPTPTSQVSTGNATSPGGILPELAGPSRAPVSPQPAQPVNLHKPRTPLIISEPDEDIKPKETPKAATPAPSSPATPVATTEDKKTTPAPTPAASEVVKNPPPQPAVTEEVKSTGGQDKADVAAVSPEQHDAEGKAKKKNRKDILKKADEGNYKALNFDAYSEKPKPTSTPEVSAPAPEEPKEEIKAPVEDEDDDWENKDESELVKLKDKTPGAKPDASSKFPSDMSASIKASIKYPTGIWRPDNTAGTKKYPRDFLMQFEKLCTDRPENLQMLGDVPPRDAERSPQQFRNADRGSQGRGGGGSFRDQRGPQRPMDSMRNGAPPPGFAALPGRAGPRQGLSMRQPRPIIRNVRPAPEFVNPLPPTPGRWEPSSRKRDSSEEEIKLKTATGILNKITEEKFDELSTSLLAVKMTSAELLQKVMTLIFDKALSEPKFGKMYAGLCVKMAAETPDFEPENGEESSKRLTFKRILLNTCQSEFESAFNASKMDSSEQKEKEKDSTASKDEKPDVEKESRSKKRMLGNISFIGELFKVSMLGEKIMHACIKTLMGDLQNSSDDDIEALCRLMTSIGARIDTEAAAAYMEEYFRRMKELQRSNTLSLRIKFMIQTVIELRNQKWISVRENNALNVSKSSDKDIARLAQPASGRQQNQRGTPLRGSQASPATSRVNEPPADQWEVVGGRSNKQRSGPQRTEHQDVRVGMKQTSTPSGRGMSTSRSFEQLSSRASQPERPLAKAVPAKVEKTEEELESATTEILEEFFSSAEIAEAATCIQELKSPHYHHEVVNKLIGVGIEKGEKERELVAELILQLCKDKILTDSQLLQGLDSVFAMLDDIVIDIPQAPAHLAWFIAPLVADDIIPLSFLNRALKPFIESSGAAQAAEIAAEILCNLNQDIPDDKLVELVKKHKLDLLGLLPPDANSKEAAAVFLDKKMLSFLSKAW